MKTPWGSSGVSFQKLFISVKVSAQTLSNNIVDLSNLCFIYHVINIIIAWPEKVFNLFLFHDMSFLSEARWNLPKPLMKFAFRNLFHRLNMILNLFLILKASNDDRQHSFFKLFLPYHAFEHSINNIKKPSFLDKKNISKRGRHDWFVFMNKKDIYEKGWRRRVSPTFLKPVFICNNLLVIIFFCLCLIWK